MNEAKITIETVIFEKTPNFGSAPVYWLKLYRSGKAEYEGIAHTDIVGSFVGEVAFESYDNLCSRIKNSNIVKLKDRYEKNMTCGSTEILQIVFSNGKVKRIEDYFDAGPTKLKEIKSKLKSMVREISWRQIEPRYKPSKEEIENLERKESCHCGSGKRFENCHGFVK
jgi:hypothetical protein